VLALSEHFSCPIASPCCQQQCGEPVKRHLVEGRWRGRSSLEPEGQLSNFWDDLKELVSQFGQS